LYFLSVALVQIPKGQPELLASLPQNPLMNDSTASEAVPRRKKREEEKKRRPKKGEKRGKEEEWRPAIRSTKVYN
jgi:hypothetical protein